MRNCTIILHASPDASDQRALTALRLAGALLADNKAVNLFLVEAGAQLVDSNLAADNPCRALRDELIEVGLEVHVCGATLRKLGWEEATLPKAVKKSSMKALSALLSEADEVLTF